MQGLPFEIVGLKQAAGEMGVEIDDVEENGADPLENATLKAKAYYECLRCPVFSCDSGLYLWNAETKELLPETLQPGIYVRGRGEKRLTDEELIAHYTGLVKEYGPILARYKNGICLIADETHSYQSMDESLWGEAFLLTDVPHPKRIPGFPLDSISLEISSGKYYYDLVNDAQDDVAAQNGFRQFFTQYMKDIGLCDE